MKPSINVLGRSPAAHRRIPALPRVGNAQQRVIRPILTSAVEVATPAAVESAPEQPSPAPAEASGSTETAPKLSDRRKNNRGRKGAERRFKSRSGDGVDQATTNERLKELLKGDAVALSISPNADSVSACFKQLRPLFKAMKSQGQTLLFFPSTRVVKPQQPKEGSDSAETADQPQEQQKKSQEQQRQRQERLLEVALVAVPSFQKPDPEVNIRVGAKSKPESVARHLTSTLLRSSSVAISAAGPGAALVTLLAAAQARRAIGAQEQLDLAFSLNYRVLAPEDSDKPAAEEEQQQAGEAAGAAGAVEGSSEASSTDAGKSPVSVVTQFSFYKRALPTPEVLVSDFAPTLAVPAMAQLLTSLIAERREVDLLLDSKDALFAVQTLSRVVRDAWIQHKASVGAFLTSLTPDPEDEEGRHFSARLQLRRIPSAPNLVPVSPDRPSLLGPPVGIVKWDTPVEPLAKAIGRELNSAGIFSILPVEGLCFAKTLRALWEAQQARAAQAAVEAALAAATAAAAAAAAVSEPASADAAATAEPADGVAAPAAAAASEAPSSPVFQIAIVPEVQQQQQQQQQQPERGTADGGKGERAGGAGRVTVLHLLELSPVLGSCLRATEGRVVPIANGEQLRQLLKAVILRNRMYSGRQGGKVLTLRPLLDDHGILAVRLQNIDSRIVAAIPPPPPLRQDSGPAARARAQAVPTPAPPPAAVEDGYATDDEFGVGAEAAVLVPPAAVAAAAAAAGGRVPVPTLRQQKGSLEPGAKSPWIMFVTDNTSSMRLAMGVVAETCKPYDRRCPIWLRFKARPDNLATGALAVAMSQAQVQERGNVELLVVPTLERKRDDQVRPYNALVWQLIKHGPGAEPGAAAAAAAAAATAQAPGPSPSAMAAAAAAAAKVRAQGDALITGTRKLW